MGRACLSRARPRPWLVGALATVACGVPQGVIPDRRDHWTTTPHGGAQRDRRWGRAATTRNGLPRIPWFHGRGRRRDVGNLTLFS
jgi:hypothetical protein